MLERPTTSLVFGLSLLLAPALGCGDDGSGDEGSDEVGDTTGDTGDTTGDGDTTTDTGTDTTTDTGTDTTTDTGTDTTTDTGTDTTDTGTDTTTDTGGDCQVWEITYDMDGSAFEISGTPLGAGDQVNNVEMPYDADDTVGPGTIVVRFQDVDGAPGGLAAMYSYDMSMHFSVSGSGVTVATDLENSAGPESCGITTAELNGTTAAWNPSAVVNHHSMGQILCTGAFCQLGGLPDGDPVPVDETSDMPISEFVFADDFSAFDMATTAVPNDNDSTTEWTFVGTELSRELVDAPACLCP